MKRINLKKYGKWKNYKRPSFHFWFILLSTAVVAITIGVSDTLATIVQRAMPKSVEIPTIVFTLAFGLIIGGVLSACVGLMLLKPIRKIQSAMTDVTDGDLSVNIEEKSRLEEVENIYHSFNLMIKELRSNQAMQKDFVSNVSHEFKTPLSTIEGYATLLQDGSLSQEEREEYAKEIANTTRDMTELVGNILLLSKISNQAIDFKKEEFSLDEQLRKVVVNLEPRWSQKNIELDVEFDNVRFVGNEVLIYNVWRNLIENAIKFSPDNGKVSIYLKKQNDNVIFTVTDQGQGVKEEDKKLIFDKFYQADTSHKQEGNGLGLPLVKTILELFSGSVQVENVIDENSMVKGCSFTVTLPQ